MTRRAAFLGIAAAAVIAAVLFLALGGGGRNAARRGRVSASARDAVVQRAAGYLGVSPAEVRRRLRGGETLGELAAARKGGSRQGLIQSLYAAGAAAIRARHLSPAAEAARLRELRRALTAQIDHARRRAGLLRSAAVYLGMSEATLAAKLAGGRTLAQVAATTPGRSRAGLVEALVAERRRTIERALAENALPPAAAKRAIARLRSRAERQVQLSDR